ncbi:MAG: hypothetical protein E6G95_06285 [Alphaproteobacteria bacterium]|nr:MAG: hypothetical protein E6G95_06285 [Alphaproteobacteria bacterium]
MKRRFLLASMLILPSVARAQADEWQTVVAPDLRFRLEMPTPATKTAADEKEKGHASVRVAWESRRGEQIFNFDYVDYDAGWFSSRDSKEMARELGRGDAEKAFAKPKYKYVRDEPIVLQGWDGYALDIDSEGGAGVMMRTYIAKDRLFRMLVTVGSDITSKNAAGRFLDSLKLAESRETKTTPIEPEKK